MNWDVLLDFGTNGSLVAVGVKILLVVRKDLLSRIDTVTEEFAKIRHEIHESRQETKMLNEKYALMVESLRNADDAQTERLSRIEDVLLRRNE